MLRRVCQHLVKQAKHLCVTVVHKFLCIGGAVYLMWCAVYAVCHSKTAAPDIKPLGTCVSARVFWLLYVCVFVCKGQSASHQCHWQRQRKTLMLFHTDTYLTPLSLALTVLKADICVLLCRTVTSHQTMYLNSGLKPLLLLHNHISAPSLSSFAFLSFSSFPNLSAVWIPI